MRNPKHLYSQRIESLLYSTMSDGVVTSGAPAGVGGRSRLYGHCLGRRYTPAAMALTTPALDGALFICPSPATERRA